MPVLTIRPMRSEAVAKARGELQDSLLPAHFTEIELGRAKTEAERAAEVFDVIQLPALQTVIESGTEAVGDQIRRDLQTNVGCCRIVTPHRSARDLLFQL